MADIPIDGFAHTATLVNKEHCNFKDFLVAERRQFMNRKTDTHLDGHRDL